MTTAATPALDLEAVIAAANDDIAALTAERERLGLAVLRREAGAETAWAEADAKLNARLHNLRQAEGALLALDREQEAEAMATSTAEREALEADRAKADKELTGRLTTVEEAAAILADAVEEAISAANGHYNAGVALGLHGNPVAVRDRIAARISHVLNLAGLPDFDIGIGPSARTPLDGEATPLAIPPPRPALPDRRDIRDDETHRITQTFLKDAEGEWVEVQPGATDLPAKEASA